MQKASVSRVGLSAQATEVSDLKFENNYGYYVDQSNNTLRMWATFKVTNNSDRDLSAPTFIPVDTDGAQGTIGATAFRDVKYFDGSDASDKAAALRFTTSNDPNTAVSTPLISNLDSGSVQVSAPAGSTLSGLSRSGWQMKAIPAGGTGEITLAASIPTTTNQTQNPFSFSLVFTVADAVPVFSTAITNIGAVQGSTPGGNAASPLSGQSVTVSGVVTGFTQVWAVSSCKKKALTPTKTTAPATASLCTAPPTAAA